MRWALIDFGPPRGYNGSREEEAKMEEEMTVQDWDDQYSRQAGWTRATREHLYRRANLLRAERVLDVGSGTGTITEEVAARTRGKVIGLDQDPSVVAFSQGRQGQADYRLGDAHDMPFPDAWFDIVVCHFLLMWCTDPFQVAQEMVRVTASGGSVLVCAEPDYCGRIDFPDLPLGQWQADALRREGADPCLGRMLRAIFALPRVRSTSVGIISGLWDMASLRAEFRAEWSLWERSFSEFVPPDEIVRVRETDLAAIEAGSRLAFMPVFHCLARV
jgi:ubiquinone/menaquinone biosynthesis C-methylase UbiE